jgi:hypothetical protein
MYGSMFPIVRYLLVAKLGARNKHINLFISDQVTAKRSLKPSIKSTCLKHTSQKREKEAGLTGLEREAKHQEVKMF